MMVLFLRVARKFGRVYTRESCYFDKIQLFNQVHLQYSSVNRWRKVVEIRETYVSRKRQRILNIVRHENKGKNSHWLGKKMCGIQCIHGEIIDMGFFW